jgi:hypothetical protein
LGVENGEESRNKEEKGRKGKERTKENHEGRRNKGNSIDRKDNTKNKLRIRRKGRTKQKKGRNKGRDKEGKKEDCKKMEESMKYCLSASAHQTHPIHCTICCHTTTYQRSNFTDVLQV